VVVLPPLKLWQRVRDEAGLSKAEFDAYFAGADVAYAIEVKKTWRIAPVTLSAMRKLRVRPPQSYQYLDTPLVMRLWRQVERL
jgi:predicted transcriptional regulator